MEHILIKTVIHIKVTKPYQKSSNSEIQAAQPRPFEQTNCVLVHGPAATTVSVGMTATNGIIVAVPQTTAQVPHSIVSVIVLVAVWIVATLLGIVPGSKSRDRAGRLRNPQCRDGL
jgi:hypothetical protein